MVFVQWSFATFSKAKQPSAVPGKIDDSLSHDSFIFRAHRTFQNTLENSPLFIGATLFAFFIGIDGSAFEWCVWVYLIARIVHMALYYSIATEKNPSPRSYFFLVGLAANITILALIGEKLVNLSFG
jgi:uncharacterized MAPEG superfamily protein